MKYLAIFLIIALILSIGGVGMMYMTSMVVVESTGAVHIEASAQPELFNALVRQSQNGALVGTVFKDEPIGDIEQYQFIAYNVRLRNDCLIDAESLELQVYPMQGDIVQLGEEAWSKTLAAQSTGDYQATILTDASMHSIRELNITYYMWGLPFTLRTTCGN